MKCLSEHIPKVRKLLYLKGVVNFLSIFLIYLKKDYLVFVLFYYYILGQINAFHLIQFDFS